MIGGSADVPNFDVVVKHDLGYCICLHFFSFTIEWPPFLMDEWTTTWLLTHQWGNLTFDDKVQCGRAIDVKGLKLIIDDKL